MVRGDILLIRLPSNRGGHEQAGRRPAVTVQADHPPSVNSPLLMVIPCTSKLNALRFPHTVRVEPSDQNGLTMPTVLLVFQLRAIDRQRILQKIGRLEPNYLGQVNNELQSLLGL